ncbi:MAG TPA: amino acid adenylation domain-containing protein [Thermoanaerobaculia bacterium]
MDRLLHELFLERAARAPAATAVVDGHERLSYGELARRSGELAAHLRRLGAGPETRVAVCLERSARLPAALLGVLRAGGAYVPLDPAYPRERLAYTLADSGAAVLLTEEKLLPFLPPRAGPTLLIDRLPDAPAWQAPDLSPGLSPDNLAYVIYTSGSTGRPKGVAISHRSIAAYVEWTGTAFTAAELAGVFAHTSYAFDFSMMDLFMPLAHGGAMILGDDALSLHALPAADEVTLINMVPSAMTELLRLGPLPASVRTVNLGGEPVRRAVVERVYAAGRVGKVHNLYGPTEDTVFSTCGLVARGDEREPSIGRAIPGGRVLLADGGEPGEILLGGIGLARGYLNRPELTAERFVPDPWSGVPGARLYRTGDLGRRRPDGDLECLGRADQQVKIRGYRVELGEIEAVLAEHPRVREAAVALRADESGDQRLVAWVAGEAATAELRSLARRRLPGYMVPSAFVLLDALPRNPNGKVDRGALPAPQPLAAGGSYAAPRDPTEALLAAAWADALGIERAGIHDDLFELGGHSLTALSVLARLREERGIDLPLRAVFEAPTPAALAARLGRPAEPPAELAEETPAGADGDGPFPLSFAQERLWFLHRLNPGEAAYNVPLALRLSGRLDVAALRRSLGEIVRRHESLRTVFPEGPEGPYQTALPAAGDFPLPLVDVAALPLPEREALRLVEAEARRPFDLEAGPPFRALLVRLAEGEWRAVLDLHHIVGDGWSLDLLLRELEALYRAFHHGNPSPLPEPPLQYADYAVWQRERLRGAALDDLLAFWRDELAGAPAELELPADRPRPATQRFRGSRIVAATPAPPLHRLARQQGATPFMALLAGLQAFLYRVTGQGDLAVGAPVADRGRTEIEGIIGLFVNTLVLRGRIVGGEPFRGLLERTKTTVVTALAHQDLPFERLVNALGIERRLDLNPLFQVTLAFQGAPPAPPALPETVAEILDLSLEAVPFDLGLSVEQSGDRFDLTLELSSDLFDPATALRLLHQLRRLLEGAAATPELPVRDLPLLSAAERHQAIVEWNDSGVAGSPAAAPRLFAEQARRTPDAVALAHGERRVSYGELDERASRLARRLRARGVGPESRVGLLAERSPEMVAALLGIWRAGGAFVPLDPGQPDARLAGLLEDAFSGVAAPVLVTESGLRERLAGFPLAGVSIVCLDEEEEAADAAFPPIRPGDPAYLIYTSGTTGRPKAVLVEHGSLAHTLRACREAFGFSAADRMPCLAPFTFDIFLFELLAPLLAGGTSVLFDLRPTLDVRELTDSLGGMTLLHAVPALMRQVVEEARRLPEAARSLRRVFVGGDAVPADLLADLREVFPAARTTVLYGPTETAILATRYEVDIHLPGDRRPIGRPLADVSVRVVDGDGNPVPPGTPGELWIGGPGVARGYLHREELTAETFVEREGQRRYRTGDRARWRPDGVLEFLGRTDDQIKIRGFRIEPGEVEAALAAHPDVREAAVGAREDAAGNRELAAWVAGNDPRPAALAAFLRERLPEFMVPTVWAVLPQLPLSPHGKVDRKALPAPASARGAETAAFRSPAEELLAGIWAALLRRDRVGPDDDFFASGGHSLLALQAVSRIRDAFGVEIPVAALFEAPTPAALARRLETTGESTPPPPIAPAGRSGDLPLSFAQERLWFLDQLQPGSLYNVPLVLRLRGGLDVPAWAAAWDEVRRRHEVLRTTFGAGHGRSVQVIAPHVPAALPVVDLAGLPVPAREADRLAAAAAARPFDLAGEAPARACLVRLAGDDHLFLAVFHHIASDAWSTGVLLAEMRELYGGSPLPGLPVQYADYAVWERRRLAGPELDARIGWWRERLAGLPVLELPADHPRPAVQSFRGRTLPESLQAEVGRALASLRGGTLFMVALAAFATLLHRITGSADLAVGIPVANRDRPELEGLIGFFVNTLVARLDLSGDPPFSGLLARVRETALAAYAHREVPFDRLVEELRPERRPDENPLFQVAFSLDRPQPLDFAGVGLDLDPVPAHSGTAKFDLYLALMETPAGIDGSWEFKTDLFDAPTIVRLAGHWRNLVADLAAHPERRLGELALLSAAERHQTLVEWTATAADYPRDATLPELFARQVERAPDAVALVHAGEILTYRELDARAGEIAGRLRPLGVGADVPVALALPRSFDLIATILGILKAGGAYVPLDPSHPRERIAQLVRDSGAAVLVTPEGVIPVKPAAGPAATAHADSLAYIMYTSGSTGLPKGVAVTHRNVARLVLGTDYARFGPDEVFLQLAPTSFDASTLEIWGPLLNGGRLVLPPEGRLSLAELGAIVRGEGVTTLWLTAGLFHQMVDEEIGGLAGVRQLLAGGDVVAPDRVRRALESLPGAVVINGYGPTEGTTFSACHRIAAPDDVGVTVPIGRPIANTTAWVLDAGMRPAPAGVPGDLHVGGDGLARGYLGRPDLTAERFVPDPFSRGGRLYRTGDRARWLPNGRLDFLGRSDLQVKIAGWRIEPGEIEAALLAHPDVREAAVAAVEEGDGKRLAAWVAGPPATADLRAWLRDRLPEPMVPSLWVHLDRLPLTPNGKVDRAALPPPGAARETAGDAPATPTEELLGGLWAELLGVERVGIHDDFFALGGHSLLATRLVARLRGIFGIDLPLRAFFEEPTVAGLAGRVTRGEPLPPIEPLPALETYPASLAQRRLWFLDRLAPAGFFLNVSHGLRLRGDLSAPALERALEEIVARHEPLRTAFEARDGQPVQRIAPPGTFSLPMADLASLPPERREAEARRLARAEAERPFDLARSPLFRTVLLRLGVHLGAGDHLLVFTPHHLVFDGWSMGVLFRELAALYAGTPLPPPPVRFAELAAWQRQTLSGARLEGQLAWWRQRLTGLPTLDLPTDHPRPPAPRFGGGWRTAVFPGLLRKVEATARRHGVTPFLALLAGFEILLSRVSGQEDFPVGTPAANRSRPEIEGLIGFFANTLVMRADLAGSPTVSELLARVRETALGAWTHQDLPFEVLVEALAPERNLNVNPLFQVVLSLQDLPPGFDLPGLEARLFELDADVAHFDLTLLASRDGDALALTLNFKRDLFEPPTALRLLDQLGTLLEAAVAGPEIPVRDLPLWSEAAWHQAVREWSGFPQAPGGGLTADRRFEEQARRTPEALAVAGPEERLTYGELNRRANRLAHHLRRLGAGRGTRIAVALERSPELVTAALAVWKAGGAYLPLDPAGPAERLAGVVEDAGAPWVLTLDRWAGSFPGRAIRLDALDTDEEPWAVESDLDPDRETGPGDAAYVIYTSGSTGRPKGVEVPHAGLGNLIDWHLRAYGVTPADRASLVASPAFDASVWEIWPALAAGASLHAPPREVAASPAALLEWLAAEGITLAFLPTPLAEEALSRELPPGLSLRALLTGGDRLRRVPAADLGFRLVNHYGPTEAAVVATCGDVRPDIPQVIPGIGRPIDGVEVLLLDPGLRPVPLGVLGEICLGGQGLATGYPGHPDLTARRFVPHPLAAEPGARLYRTGDLARFRPDGRIEFAGRADDQVKIRGFRVEPGEVEARLAAHPAVLEAVVAAVNDGPAGPRLAAWIVPRPGTAPAAGELRDFLRAFLPEPMVPSAWVTLAALPLTSRGKVDRAALPPPAPAAPVSREAPRGEIEETLERLWREVLGIGAAGRDDNFFDLGGHSLALAAVHERLQAELDVRLPLVELFENPTLRSLAARLDRREAEMVASVPPEALGRAERQRSAAAWKERTRLARGLNRS